MDATEQKQTNILFSKLDTITDTIVCDSAKTVDLVVDPKRDISPASGCLAQGQTTSQAMCTRHGPVSDMTMHRLQEAEGNSGAEVSVKRRKIHMKVIECSRHSATENGGQALKTPALTKTSSKDPNRGLYPRERTSRLKLNKSTAAPSFVSAKDVLHQTIKHVHSQDQAINKPAAYSEPSKCSPVPETIPRTLPSSRNAKSRNRKLPAQSNSLLNYFKQKSDNERTVSSSPESSPVKINIKLRTVSSQQHSLQQFGFNQSPVNTPTSDSITSQHMSNPVMNSVRKQIFQNTDMSSRIGINANQIASGMASANLHQCNKTDLGVDTRNSGLVSQNPSVDTSCEDTYGLLGMGLDECIDLRDDDDDDDLNYFSQLPVEVIENILCRLPTSDLLLNVSLVCSQWNDIIAAPKVQSV